MMENPSFGMFDDSDIFSSSSSPSPSSSSSSTCTTSTMGATATATGPLGSIYDQISHTIFDDDEEDRFQLQPTPIGCNGQVIVVSELSAQDDSNLFESDVASDILALLASSPAPSSSNKNDYNNNNKKKRSSCDYDYSYAAEPAAKKQRTSAFSVKVSNDNRNDVPEALSTPLLQQQQQECLPRATAAATPGAPTHHWNKWDTRLQDLLHFKQTHGHCRVPNIYPENTHLAQWVKRQRYQHKLKQEGKHSTLSQERQHILDCVGFVWDAHECTWMERWNELKDFYKEHGHSHVPTNYAPNRQLSIWVKCQRRQYKLYTTQGGAQSNMTVERVKKMESLNFNWNPRNLKCQRSYCTV